MADITPSTNETGRVTTDTTIGRGAAILGGGLMVTQDMDPTPAWRWPVRIDTIDAMRRDAQVMTLENATIVPIRRWRWSIDPSGASDEVTSFVARNLGLPITDQDPEPATGKFSFAEHLRLALRAPSYGAAWFEQVAEYNDDDDKYWLKKLAPRPLRTIQKVDVARDGGLVSITQGRGITAGVVMGAEADTVVIPVDRLVAYVWDADPGSWSGSSMLRALYRNYWLKDKLYRIDAMKHERFGVPMPIFEAPADATEEQMAALNIMAQAVRSGVSAGGAVPMGTRVSMIGATGTGTDVVASIVMHDEAMARAWANMVVSLGSSATGSRALGGTFADLLLALQKTIATGIVDVFNPHVIRDLVDWNWGTDEPAPSLVFSADEDPTLAVADLVAAINAGMLHVSAEDEARFRAEYGMAERDVNASVTIPHPIVALPTPVVVAAAAGDSTDPRLPDRDTKRKRNTHEVLADTDFKTLDDEWDNATTAAVEAWLKEVQPAQRDAMFAAIREADGDLIALASLVAPVLGVEIIAETIRNSIQVGITSGAAEAAAQGVKIPAVSVGDALDDIDARAEAMATTLARSYSEVAGRHAMFAVSQNATNDEIIANVTTQLDRLTDAFLRENLGAAAQGGQNAGRFAAFDAAGTSAPVAYYASEILDGVTCGPCREVDETQFSDMDAAMTAYPMLGAYYACEGGPRCRGTVVAVYDEAPATVQG